MEKPLLFTGDMVRAILAGRKTMTRRVIKDKTFLRLTAGFTDDFIKHPDNNWTSDCPYGQPGDTLWVRETWNGIRLGNKAEYWYRADEPIDADTGVLRERWRSSRSMPREAARLFLTVKNVRVERLQDITEEDARAEGCIDYHDKIGDGKFEDVLDFDLTARDAFETLWKSTNAKRGYGWDLNPWVWVIEFERVEGEG